MGLALMVEASHYTLLDMKMARERHEKYALKATDPRQIQAGFVSASMWSLKACAIAVAFPV